MTVRFKTDGASTSPPFEKGRSARGASRVGIEGARFDLTRVKTARARQLRRDSTDVEMRLWQKLRNRQLGADIRRQHPAGRFVLDFYCPALRLVVELDGGQHTETETIGRDSARTRWLEERGVTVLRFWNSDVIQNMPGVLEAIAVKVTQLRASGITPTRRWRADLSLSGEGNEPKGRN